MEYLANKNRYSTMMYNRCGKSGLKLSAISLGLWHNFGYTDAFENMKKLLLYAFDNGITHFDLANNYGPPPGSAEVNMGRIINNELKSYRDELIISSKAGYDMWEGPYGNWGSRKYLLASCNQSLKRLGLEYVDIFYSHRPDPDTPIEETMLALDQLVRAGKALYVGISNYNAAQTNAAAEVLRELKTPFIIHQPRYNLFDRRVEHGLLDVLEKEGLGSIVFSPLEQGMLSDKYLNGIPADSRAAKETSAFLNARDITPEKLSAIKALNIMAEQRGQSLAQMAIAWLLKDKRITSVLVGASKTSQLNSSINSLNKLAFSNVELQQIDEIVKDVKYNC